MSTRLMVLGLLHENSYYGYEIKRIMKERYMDEWANIAFGSIYFSLKQMTLEGLVQPESTEKNGNRPSRTIYAITKEGRQQFIKLLRDNWQAMDWPPEVMRVCLIFVEALPREEIEVYLEQRLELLDQKVKHIQTVGEEVSIKGAPWVARYVWQYDIELCNKTQEVLRKLLDDIGTARVDWSPFCDDSDL